MHLTIKTSRKDRNHKIMARIQVHLLSNSHNRAPILIKAILMHHHHSGHHSKSTLLMLDRCQGTIYMTLSKTTISLFKLALEYICYGHFFFYEWFNIEN